MQERLRPYRQALPDIFSYQILTKPLIAAWLFLLERLTQALLKSTGRVAVTSGDFLFLFQSWQGYLIILIGLVSLYTYMAFDLNTKIVLSRELAAGRKASVWECIKEGWSSIRRLISPRGIFVILYIALIAPIIGLGLSITETKGLYIPAFISSVIGDTPMYRVLASVVVIAFLIVGIANLFVLHGVVLDRLSVKEAARQSMQLLRKNWRDYVKQNLLFFVVMAVFLAVVTLAVLILPLAIVQLLPLGGARRVLLILLALAGSIICILADLLITPLYLMKMTQLYTSYKKGEKVEYGVRETGKTHRILPWLIITAVALVLVSIGISTHFDAFFPNKSSVQIIAHRAGGNEGAENTVAGLDAAVKAGAYGSEIDIQRTKDGEYVLLHDGNFKRVAGEEASPEELMLDEIRALSVDGEPIPTLEEALEASRGRLVLFVELKGETADYQMADDAVKSIRANHMEEECVLISLKYDLIDYIENKYPDIQTGFLAFVSFGNTAQLNCDYLGLEEETATAQTVSAVHGQNKKLLVWTPNEADSQKSFLCSNADGIITDNVVQAMKIRQELGNRTDLQRIIDRIMMIVR